MNKYKILLAGNPNVGKSTIFNYLTGLKQHTGNWPGKTVDNASGYYYYNNKEFLIYDLPGMYSLIPRSKEEFIAREKVCFGKDIDCIVVVVSSLNLKRGLNLLLQILEINSNVLLVVNLMDEAKKKKIDIDLVKLSSILGIKVVGTVASYDNGIDELVKEVDNICVNGNKNRYIVKYDKDMEKDIRFVMNNLNISRWNAIRLLCGDSRLYGDELVTKYKINNFEDRVCSKVINDCHDIYKRCVRISNNYLDKEIKIDKIITSKKYGIPIMILSLLIIFWITIVGSNYPSKILGNFLFGMEDNIYNFFSFLPVELRNMFVYGVYKTTSWVISVMLPPMMIFFPLFTILEDIGFLPRIAFNMDGIFSKCNVCGKQCLTMCMGIGCNAVGVTGSRIIDSKNERLLSIITNSFMPCNGRYPVIIAIISMFFVNKYNGLFNSLFISFFLVMVIILCVIMTFVVCKILSIFLFDNRKVSFILELPDYRHVRIGKVLINSIMDRTIFVLGRAIMISVPAGIVIYLFNNICFDGVNILSIVSNFLNPLGLLMGLDGVILVSFLLGLPANEIVLPIILMIYLHTGILTDYDSLDSLKNILISNGWTYLTAINFIIFSLFHFPCGTTLLTIKKETNSWFYTFLSFVIPLIIGISLCIIFNFLIKILI